MLCKRYLKHKTEHLILSGKNRIDESGYNYGMGEHYLSALLFFNWNGIYTERNAYFRDLIILSGYAVVNTMMLLG